MVATFILRKRWTEGHALQGSKADGKALGIGGLTASKGAARRHFQTASLHHPIIGALPRDLRATLI